MAELVSKRYASALFEVAFENQQYELVNDELGFVLNCLQDEPKLYQLLEGPLLSSNEKKEVISAIFKKNVSKEVFNFLCIVIDKGRESYIESITEEYKVLADSVKNKVDAVAITAVSMDKQDLLKLQVNLSISSGKNVQLQNQIDPTVIGGVLVKIGDKVIDGTVKNRLAKMQEQLSQILV